MQLRPYQQEAILAINSHWEDWQRELLVLPTGCGKTVVFNSIAHERPGQTLILAHREELIEQARDKYEAMFGERPGKIKAAENDIRRVTVGSIQTMMRRDYKDAFDTVIIDEAHHAVSPSYQKLLTQLPEAKVLGVTATPDRGDKKSLAKYFDGIAYEYGLKTAVADGYLCEIKAKTIPLEIDMSNCKISVGDFQVDSVGETLEPYLPQIAQRKPSCVFMFHGGVLSADQHRAGAGWHDPRSQRSKRRKFRQKRDARMVRQSRPRLRAVQRNAANRRLGLPVLRLRGSSQAYEDSKSVLSNDRQGDKTVSGEGKSADH